MTQDQFYRTTIQLLRQLRIPFVDPCDSNYTGDCICGETTPLPYRLPTTIPSDAGIDGTGIFVPVVDQDGDLAGLGGWFNLENLGGGNGIFDAANNDGTIAITSLLQDQELFWEGQGNDLSFGNMSSFNVLGVGSDRLAFSSDPNSYGSLYFFAGDRSTDNFGPAIFNVNPEEGFIAQTNNPITDNQSFILIVGSAGPITIETPDDQSIKIGSNTYFERGNTYAKIAATDEVVVEANSDENLVSLTVFDSSVKTNIAGTIIENLNSRLTIDENYAEFYDNTYNQFGIQLINFGEQEDGTGGDYLAMAPNSLVPKAYVDTKVADARPYKVYTALLTQTGTDAPVATVLENTLGGTVTWSRFSEGGYITAEEFNPTKTYISYSTSNYEEVFLKAIVGIENNEIGPIIIRTLDNTISLFVDNALSIYPLYIEIRVYP